MLFLEINYIELFFFGLVVNECWVRFRDLFFDFFI